MKNNLFNTFLEFEEKNHLFDIEFKGFKIWEIMRTYIYIDIEMYENKLQPLFPQEKSKKSSKRKISNLRKILKVFFIKNQDLIFLNNPRRVKQNDGKYYCIYTDLLIDELKDEFKCLTLEDPYWALSPTMNIGHLEPVKTENIGYLDGLEIIFNLKKKYFKNFKKQEYKQLKKIIYDIELKVEKKFKVDLTNIFQVAFDKVLYLVLLKKNYDKLISRLNPQAILEFYDVFPSKIIVNKIAKERNIPIIEIQHGIVTSKNPIFLKYLNQERCYDCLPDYVLAYGEKLLNTSYMPIKKENIYYLGNLFLEYKKNKYQVKIANSKKIILFISQSNLGQYISQFAGELATLLKDNEEYEIIYKMHPYEIGTNYECLNKSNIKIVTNKECDLYKLLANCVAQVGIYSTGLYEGLAFNLKTFIINHHYGTQEIKEILKEGKGIYYVDKPKDILYKLDIKNIGQYKYWAKVDKKLFKLKIKEIIDK